MVALRRQIDSLKFGTSASSGTSLRSQLNSEEGHAGRGAPALRRGVSGRQEAAARHRNARSTHQGGRARRCRDVRRHAGGHAAAHADQCHRQPARQHHGAECRSLRAKLTGLENNVTSAPQVEREYANATRDLTIAREKYEQLLNRQMDAEVSEAAIVGGRADEFRLIQAPMLPGVPSKPAAPGHPVDRPCGRGGPRPDRHGGRRSARSEGARRARRARAAVGVAAGRHSDDPQFAFATPQCLAVRRRHAPVPSSACGSPSPSSAIIL